MGQKQKMLLYLAILAGAAPAPAKSGKKPREQLACRLHALIISFF